MNPGAPIVHAEALAWLAAHSASPATSVVTSLPDRSELGGMSSADWRSWFVATTGAILGWLPADGVAIFYQTDVRHAGVWVDKSYLVLRAAEAQAIELIWHKIVCRQAPDSASREGRPSYSHLLCLARSARAPRQPVPDVLSAAGASSWKRAMGAAACQLACDYLQLETATRCVVDPFCGRGSVLAVAYGMGFDVIGVDNNAKRCRAARGLLARARLPYAALQRGAVSFDRGDFFAAHEAWEERWRVTPDASERRYLQGLIQVAAAFHKLFVMRGAESAQRLLGKGLEKLAGVERASGFDLAAFQSDLQGCAAELAAGSFERTRVPQLLTRGIGRGAAAADEPLRGARSG